MRLSQTVVKVFLGCCSSAFLMEILMSKCPQSANLITFLQFLCISLQGFVFTVKYGTIKPKIPLKHYAILIALFFVTSVANNYVYALHVPSTLHMIIRSASSPASMFVYCIVKKQLPRISNTIGSILISFGVVLATYGGAPGDKNEGIFLYWCIGVIILLSTLITGAFTGIQQEILYAKYGKHPTEMMFFTHALPLPFFLAISSDLFSTGSSLTQDIWFLIALNIISQFYCTHSVHQLATKETSVTVTFILTLRKFVSLLISSIVFKNNLTSLHILGTICVIIGTVIYFNFFENLKQRPVTFVSNNEKKKLE